MPPLSNPRHERFAQELAKGKTQTEAHTLAGYKGDRTAASHLATNLNIQRRVGELLQRAAERTEISVASLTDRLMNLADLAETTASKEDEETGEITATSPKHLSVARQALMDAAKLNGLVIDRMAQAQVKWEDLLDGSEADTGAGEGVQATTH